MAKGRAQRRRRPCIRFRQFIVNIKRRPSAFGRPETPGLRAFRNLWYTGCSRIVRFGDLISSSLSSVWKPPSSKTGRRARGNAPLRAFGLPSSHGAWRCHRRRASKARLFFSPRRRCFDVGEKRSGKTATRVPFSYGVRSFEFFQGLESESKK